MHPGQAGPELGMILLSHLHHSRWNTHASYDGRQKLPKTRHIPNLKKFYV
ncbi:hypothetical protein BHM03_00009828 [Ensete ventricosum]|nr:hypothetical protein BHM03_00009828 [Ensete ventricosum]